MFNEETELMMEDSKIYEEVADEAYELLNKKFPDTRDFGGTGGDGGFAYDFKPNEKMGSFELSIQCGVGYIYVCSVDTKRDWEDEKRRYPDKKTYEYASREEYSKKLKTAVSYLKRLEKKYSRD